MSEERDEVEEQQEDIRDVQLRELRKGLKMITEKHEAALAELMDAKQQLNDHQDIDARKRHLDITAKRLDERQDEINDAIADQARFEAICNLNAEKQITKALQDFLSNLTRNPVIRRQTVGQVPDGTGRSVYQDSTETTEEL